MSTGSKNPLSRLAIHTITHKSWSLETMVEKHLLAGVQGISVWRYNLEGRDPTKVRELFLHSGIKVVSLVRGGFFTGSSRKERDIAIRENKKALEEAAGIGAEMLVLVCGATPGQPLQVSRDQIEAGIEKILHLAAEYRIKLAIEPLHPMYADSRSAITTLQQANRITESFKSPWLGVALDIYHVWWDESLEAEIRRCGKHDHLFAVHICDWRYPTRDFLNDRTLMGRGILDIQNFINWVNEAGFKGFFEVEIFSDEYWAMDQDVYLSEIIEAYSKYSI